MLIKLNILKYIDKLVILTILFLFFSCHNSSDISFKNFDIVNLAESSYGDEFIVLDVRTNQERANGFLANSTHIDFYDEFFLDKLNLLEKTKPICIYCMVGGRSSKAANKIVKAGFNEVYNLNGGFLKWSNNNLPIEIPEKTNEVTTQQYNKSFLDSAINSNPNLLLYVSTKWCAPCKKMNPVIDSLSKNYIKELTVLKLDLDQNMFLNEVYDMQSIPLFVLYKNNQQVWLKNGIIAYGELATKL